MNLFPSTLPVSGLDHRASAGARPAPVVFLTKLFHAVTARRQGIVAFAVRLLLAAFAPVAALQAQTYSNPYTFTTFAGSGSSGSNDGTGTAARFQSAFGVAVDSSGNVYVADTGNHIIRKITPAGVVTTLAGTAGSPGSTDATGAAARFSSPRGVAVDTSGNVFVADTGACTIRKITPAGVVTTVAGTAGSHGVADGNGSAAQFESPYGIAADGAGNLYVSDISNNNVRKITAAGNVTTFAGSTAGSSGSAGSVDGSGTAARFNSPYGITADSSGNVFIADAQNNTIRKITTAGVVSTYSGALAAGSADGTLSAARFNLPVGVAVDAAGNVFVEDVGNHTMREITAAGMVTTLGGSPGQPAVVNATGSVARLYASYGLAVDSAENLYFAESINQVIRKAAPASVALGTANQLIGWGSGQRYQLGQANYPSGSSAPVGVLGLDGYRMIAVASGPNHVLALVADGSILGWGVNTAGQLGNNSTNGGADPVPVDTSGVLAGKVVKAIAVNALTSYALTTEGKVYAWGNGSNGELGNNSTSGSLVPVAVDTSGVMAGKIITAIAGGDGCAYALSSDGLVFSWGTNSFNQLGNGSGAANSLVPVAVITSGVLAGKTVTAIAAGGNGSSCAYALASDGHVYAWGLNGSVGALGDNTNNLASTPVAVYTAGYLSGKTIVAIAAGPSNGYALDSTGEVFSWGSNGGGELGCGPIGGSTIGTGSNVPVPVLATGALAGKTVAAVGASQEGGYALATDGSLYSWGNGSLGRTTGATDVPGLVDSSGVLATTHVTQLQAGASYQTYFVLAAPLTLAFTTQPVSQTVVAGASVTFTAAASGSPSPTYQWQKGGINIAGATSATYSIASVVAGDAGSYALVATNSSGSLTSTAAVLTVTSAPAFTTQPISVTVTAGGSASFTVAASGNPAPTFQWQKGGTNISGATGTTYTIASVVAGDAGSYAAVATNSVTSTTSSAATLTVTAALTAPVFTTQPVSVTQTAGGSVSFTVAASGNPTPTYQWQKEGTNISGATGATFTIASVAVGDAGSYTAVATNSVASTTSSAGTLTVNPALSAPVFSTQPVSVTQTAGGSVSFTAAASGNPTPTYQWQKGGVNIAGATSATYSIASVAAGDAGNYRVVATNSVAATNSSTATLTVSAVTSAPAFTTQPVSVTQTAGGSVSFTAVASGNPTPTYQWRKGTANIAGATGTTFTIAAVAAGDAGSYTVVATNSVGAATSTAATLTVNPATTAPVFTTQPASLTVAPGSAASFAVVASGNPAPTYQWQKDGVAIAGATNASYSIASVAAADAGNYTAVATNSAGTTNSAAAVLTVSAGTTSPAITTQPVNLTVTAGSSASFSVAASGNPAPTFQWYFGGAVIAGATSATLTLNNVQAANAGDYYVTATNSLGMAISTTATLTVQPQVIALLATQPVTVGHDLAISATGAFGLLQWQVSTDNGTTWQNLVESSATSGVTTSILEIVKVATAQNGTLYRCMVAGTPSSATKLVVMPAFFPSPTSVSPDSSGNFYVSDASAQTIQKINSADQVTLVAGAAGLPGSTNGSGTAAGFNQPGGLAAAADGTLSVADTANDLIRSVSSSGSVTTLAGGVGFKGADDGNGVLAKFSSPVGIARDANGVLFVADSLNNTIRRVTSTGAVTTIAGVAGAAGSADGSGTTARFINPAGVAVDAAGSIYVSDAGNNTIRKITSSGIVTTLAGIAGMSGWADGSGSGARFNNPGGLAVASSGDLYVADTGNSTIRKITSAGVVTTIAGLAGTAGLMDGAGGYAWFDLPEGLTLATDGNLYVADTGNAAIRKVTLAGNVTTLTLTAGPTSSSGGSTGSTGGSGKHSHGGGAISPWFLGALALAAFLRWLARRKRPAGVLV